MAANIQPSPTPLTAPLEEDDLAALLDPDSPAAPVDSALQVELKPLETFEEVPDTMPNSAIPAFDDLAATVSGQFDAPSPSTAECEAPPSSTAQLVPPRPHAVVTGAVLQALRQGPTSVVDLRRSIERSVAWRPPPMVLWHQIHDTLAVLHALGLAVPSTMPAPQLRRERIASFSFSPDDLHDAWATAEYAAAKAGAAAGAHASNGRAIAAMPLADDVEDTDAAADADPFSTAAAVGALGREPPASVQAARRAWHLELIKLVRMGAFQEIERRHGPAGLQAALEFHVQHDYGGTVAPELPAEAQALARARDFVGIRRRFDHPTARHAYKWAWREGVFAQEPQEPLPLDACALARLGAVDVIERHWGADGRRAAYRWIGAQAATWRLEQEPRLLEIDAAQDAVLGEYDRLANDLLNLRGRRHFLQQQIAVLTQRAVARLQAREQLDAEECARQEERARQEEEAFERMSPFFPDMGLTVEDPLMLAGVDVTGTADVGATRPDDPEDTEDVQSVDADDAQAYAGAELAALEGWADAQAAQARALDTLGHPQPVTGMEPFPAAVDFHGRGRYADEDTNLRTLESYLVTAFPDDQDELLDGRTGGGDESEVAVPIDGKRKRGRSLKGGAHAFSPEPRRVKRRRPLPDGATFVCLLEPARSPMAVAGRHKRKGSRGADPSVSPATFVTPVGLPPVVERPTSGGGLLGSPMSGSFDRNVSCEVVSPTNEEENRSTAIPWTEIMARFEPVHVYERSSAEPSPMKKTLTIRSPSSGGGGGHAASPRMPPRAPDQPVFVPRWRRVCAEDNAVDEDVDAIEDMDDEVFAKRHEEHLRIMRVEVERLQAEAELRKEKEREERARLREAHREAHRRR